MIGRMSRLKESFGPAASGEGAVDGCAFATACVVECLIFRGPVASATGEVATGVEATGAVVVEAATVFAGAVAGALRVVAGAAFGAVVGAAAPAGILYAIAQTASPNARPLTPNRILFPSFPRMVRPDLARIQSYPKIQPWLARPLAARIPPQVPGLKRASVCTHRADHKIVPKSRYLHRLRLAAHHIGEILMAAIHG